MIHLRDVSASIAAKPRAAVAASRFEWIDYAKGIIITLVVYGHSLNSATAAGLGSSVFFQSLSDAVFANSIPLFFFISGFFAERSFDKRGAQRFLIERISRIAYPYFVWSVLQGVAELVFSGQSHHQTTLATVLAIPYEPYGPFWFLYAIFWMFPVYALARMAGSRANYLLAALAAVLFVFPVPTSLMALNEFSIHLAFFAGGVIFSRYFVGKDALPEISLRATAALTCVFFGAALFVFTELVAPTQLAHSGHRYYYLCLGVLFGAMCIGWSQTLARRNGLGLLRVIGEYSLQIYVAHMLFVVAYRLLAHSWLGITDPVAIVGGGILCGIAGPVVLYRVFARLGLPSLFEFRLPGPGSALPARVRSSSATRSS